MPSSHRREAYNDYPSSRHGFGSYEDDSYDDDYLPERRPLARRQSTTRELIDKMGHTLGLGRSQSRNRRHVTVVSPSSSPSPPPDSQPRYHRRRSVDDCYLDTPPRQRYTRHGSSYSLSPTRSGSRTRSGHSRTDQESRRWEHAAKSAFDAAVVEATRLRNEPGSWTGGKGARVATAALGAAAVDALVAKDPDRHGARKAVESTIGGLLLNRVINGSRQDYRRDSRR